MKKLIQACDTGNVILDLPSTSLEEATNDLIQNLLKQGKITSEAAKNLSEEIARREENYPSAIGHAVAIPHAYIDSIPEPIVSIGRLSHPVNAGAPDGVATRFVFLLCGPPSATQEHLDTLAVIARMMSDDEFRYLAVGAESVAQFKQAIQDQLGIKKEVKPEPKIEEGLQYHGGVFKGIVGDLKRRLPHYVSDYVDGFHFRTLGPILFLFFACIAPAIIFGGLMADETGNNIGATEMIIATAFCGVCYAVFSGQPMIILGGTGPMLVFTGILYKFCVDQEIDFLPVYAWVGFWTAVILVALAVTDSSCMMRYFTRFTDEIFAALISIIFIYKAIEKLIAFFHSNGSEPAHYDVALFGVLLALGTFYIAGALNRFRQSHFLVGWFREFIADFGPTIAIASMVLVALFARPEIEAKMLLSQPPEGLTPTNPDRPWLVDFMSAPMWVIFGSIIPAILCSVLVFLDQNITARLVNSPDNNLQRGEAYHWDLGLVGILIGVCSAFGLPWLVAATVRSLNHVRALASSDQVVGKEGAPHTHILHVRENRVSGVMIHVLVGVTLFILFILQYIPLAVLYGLFLYMGVVSMQGNQFFERIGLWITDPSLYPKTHYVRMVDKWKMHAFTAIQAVCLVILWILKVSALGILFPLFIALLVPIRFFLGRFFTEKDLAALDAEEVPEEEEGAWT